MRRFALHVSIIIMIMIIIIIIIIIIIMSSSSSLSSSSSSLRLPGLASVSAGPAPRRFALRAPSRQACRPPAAPRAARDVAGGLADEWIEHFP